MAVEAPCHSYRLMRRDYDLLVDVAMAAMALDAGDSVLAVIKEDEIGYFIHAS